MWPHRSSVLSLGPEKGRHFISLGPCPLLLPGPTVSTFKTMKHQLKAFSLSCPKKNSVIFLPISSSSISSKLCFLCFSEKKESKVSQLCPTLCNPMDCSSSGAQGSSVHGIFKARVPERVAISFSRGSFWFRDQTRVSHIVGRRFNSWATRESSVSKETASVKGCS